jgi:hypothetical protein
LTADIVVIGAWKCGSTSLVEFLARTAPSMTISKQEIFHMPDDKIELHNNKPNAEYWVILRNNKCDFYHSMHEFFYPQLTFKEAMALTDVRKTGMSLEQMADWQTHIARWKKKVKRLRVVWLESMQQLNGFPHLRKTVDQFT